MKTKRTGGKSNLTRAVFCLVLAAALLSSLLVLNGFAAGADPASFDIKVDSCSTHTAAVSDGTLYIWGTNNRGQFPNSELGYSMEPVEAASDVADVSVAKDRTLVLFKNGDLYAYGWEPVSETDGLKQRVYSGIAQMSCSDDFALLVTKRGALMAWGRNDEGQLGTGDQEDSTSPVTLMESGVKKAIAGKGFSLVLKNDGSLWGWGHNEFCQLGYKEEDGSIPESLAEPTLLLDEVKDMDAGSSYSCILKNDGTLWTCGLNDSSQLGVESVDSAIGLTKILSDVSSFSAGTSHAFALTSNGTVYSWGFGLSGQLGNGTRQRGIGVTASDLNFVQLFAGDSTSFGVDSNGSLWAWGSNTNLVLGQDTGDDSIVPVRILDSAMNWTFTEPDEESHSHSQSNTDSTGNDTEEATAAPAFASGYPDGTFRPKAETTRAEFLSMLVTAVGGFDETADYGDSTFTDVDSDRWYASRIAYAQDKNLVKGYSDNTFHPNEPITRAEAAAMAAAVLDISSDASESSFTDVSGWALPHIEALASRGILSGDGDGKFRPNDPIIRSEAVTIVASATGFDPESAVLDGENPYQDVQASYWAYPYILRASGLTK